MNNKFIIVSGYGWSGSSAIIDFFKEFDNVFVPEVEFRLIKDPYGISHMEKILIENWDYINASAAIEDFLWLCNKCAKDCNHFYQPFGLNYKRLLNKNIIDITNKYISSITDFTYEGSNYYKEFKKKYLSSIFRRFSRNLSSKCHINIPYKDEKCYFLKPNREEFLYKTQKYINNIFNIQDVKNKIIVLDQAISPLHPEDMKYFSQCKMIIVDRNPVDIYIDLIKNKSLIGNQLEKTNNPYEYIKWHRYIRNSKYNNPNVKEIMFENFILDHEEYRNKIIQFIGWDLGEQKFKNKYFKIEESKRNINQNNIDNINNNNIEIIKNLLNK